MDEQDFLSVPPEKESGEAHLTGLPRVTIRHDAKMIQDLSWFVSLKTVVFLFAAGLIFTGIGGAVLWFNAVEFLPMLLLVCGVLLLIIPLIMVFSIPNGSKNALSVKNQMEGTLWFGERITEHEKSLVQEGKSIYEWTAVIRGAEDKTYFFLFVDTARAYVVKKQDLQNCTTEEFRRLLQSKLGGRFKTNIKEG